MLYSSAYQAFVFMVIHIYNHKEMYKMHDVVVLMRDILQV